jgi:hypothetical protein
VQWPAQQQQQQRSPEAAAYHPDSTDAGATILELRISYVPQFLAEEHMSISCSA